MDYCWECVYKHLCQAMVIHEEEVLMGYPKHVRRVIGHLAEASRECVSIHPLFAELLRQWRLRVMLEADIPPYDDLLDYVDIMMLMDEDSANFPEFPAEIIPVSVEEKQERQHRGGLVPR